MLDCMCEYSKLVDTLFSITVPSVGLSAGTSHGTSINELLFDIEDLVESLKIIQDRWRDIEAGIVLSSPGRNLRVEREYTGRRGRPKYIVKEEQLVFLRELRFTWSTIALMFGVSRRTMYNIRCNLGLVSTEFTGFSDIPDDHLKAIILDIQLGMPEIGQSMLRGILSSRGIVVSTVRIRECLAEVDPINSSLRWASPIKRRVYSVPYPNALWHLDGNHKLIRYELIKRSISDIK